MRFIQLCFCFKIGEKKYIYIIVYKQHIFTVDIGLTQEENSPVPQKESFILNLGRYIKLT